MTKQEAAQEAQALLEEVGKDWTQKVWKNLGWHAAVLSSCGRYYLSRYPRSNGKSSYKYSCLLGEANSYAGYWVGNGDSAQEAIQDVRTKALTDIRKSASLLDLEVCNKVPVETDLVGWTRLFGPIKKDRI